MKNRLLRVFGIVLATTICLGTTACGKSKTEDVIKPSFETERPAIILDESAVKTEPKDETKESKETKIELDDTVTADEGEEDYARSQPAMASAKVERAGAEEKEETENIFVDNSNSPLWGTKTPVSAVYHQYSGNKPVTNDKGNIELEVQTYDDGTYSYKAQNGANDFILYFAKNNKPIKMETVHFDAANPDGRVSDIAWFINGLPSQSTKDIFRYQNVTPNINLTKYEYGTGNVLQIPYTDDGEIADATNVNEYAIVDFNSDGTIARIINGVNPNNFNEETDSHLMTVFTYEDNKVTTMAYEVDPKKYDSEKRVTGVTTFKGGYTCEYNSKGLPMKVYPVDEEGQMRARINYNNASSYVYDEYGHLTSILDGEGKTLFVIDYEY